MTADQVAGLILIVGSIAVAFGIWIGERYEASADMPDVEHDPYLSDWRDQP